MSEYFMAPTPLASAVSSLTLLLIVASIYGLVSLLRGRPARKQSRGTAFGRFSSAAGRVDRAVIRSASWVTGTRYHSPTVRILVLLTLFLSLTAASVFAPWPWSLVPILVGVLAIFLVFRHWSRDEDEALENLPKDRKDLPIDGDLHLEIIIAVGFLFVLAPIAFSQLQAHGYGFKIAPNAGPFTFVIYTLIETVKAGSIVDYYDLYADRLGFDAISGAKDPSPWAKWVILAYRLSLNLLILAALKRLLDIARRRAEGHDLRHIEELLREKDEYEHRLAIEQLEDFALRGRGNARDLLERIIQPVKSDDWTVGPIATSLAANALAKYADVRGVIGALHAAIAGYQKLIAEDWRRDCDPDNWAMMQMNLGNALSSLRDFTGDTTRLKEAVTAYRNALEIYTRDAMPADWAMTQMNLGNALSRLGGLSGDATRLDEAVTAYRNALEIYTRDAMPADWAMTQMNLGNALLSLGDLSNDATRLNEAVTAYHNALEIHTRDAMPGAWAKTQMNLGNALQSLGDLAGDTARLDEAVAAFRSALEVRSRDAMPADWAMTQSNLGIALNSLGDLAGDTARLDEAVAAFRSALEVRTRDGMPADWAATQNNLGNALSILGDLAGDTARLDEAVAAYRSALEVYTRDAVPAHWATTQNDLGNALRSLGDLAGDTARLDEAVTAYRNALEVRTRDAMPAACATTQNNLAMALVSLGLIRKDAGSIDAAHSAVKLALEISPGDQEYEDTLQQAEAAKAALAWEGTSAS